MIEKYIDKFVIMQIIISLAILLGSPFTYFGLQHWEHYLGSVLLILGAIFFAISFFNLGSSFTPVVTPKEGGHLVTTGLYEHARHPIYGSILVLAIGWSIFWSSLFGVLFSIAMLYFFELKSDEEEKLLTQKYPEYAAYKERVKTKFIPYIY